MMSLLKYGVPLFGLLYLLPLCIAALFYLADGTGAGWRTADRSSIGVLPAPARHPAAVVRVFSAQTVRWKGIFASHSWIVFKPEGASSYTRYDYTAWGELPIRVNGFEPDGRWFGHTPRVIFAADGDVATALLPKIETAIGKDFPYDGRWLRMTPSGTGLRLTFGGYGGLTLGWLEGIEINLLGAVAGIDIRRPAVKLPGLGRFGLTQA